MTIFSDTTVTARQNKTSQALQAVLGPRDIVLVFSGEPIQKPGGHDQTYSFLPHPDYFWLTGSRRPRGVSAYTVNEGWVHFVQPITREEKIWEGGSESPSGKPLESFEKWLSQLSPTQVFSLGQPNENHRPKNLTDDFFIVQESFNRVRRIKDAAEINLIRKLAVMANYGYEQVKKILRPGLTERQIQLAYEMAVLSAGADKMPYDSIVGTGTNSAILHATPTSRVIQENDLILIDAGADVADYCVDITRVFAANGAFSEQQKMIYSLVQKAQSTSINLCRPGVEWHDVHKASARVFAEGLKALNIINGDTETALETGAISVFFPHGVGHMVGLRVRDVGGRFTKDPRQAFGVRVRVDMPLEAGFLMTVEPGLYFIQALLDDPDTRRKFADTINWQEVEKWRSFGGIRLEDDIHITDEGPVNLTSIVQK